MKNFKYKLLSTRTKLRALFSRRLYVTLDGKDNSLTFSPYLARVINPFTLESDRVFVFKTIADSSYGFMINPEELRELPDSATQFAHIQCDSRDKTFGFETLNPSVQRIFYDYGIGHDRQVNLEIEIKKTSTGETYYKIMNHEVV